MQYNPQTRRNAIQTRNGEKSSIRAGKDRFYLSYVAYEEIFRY